MSDTLSILETLVLADLDAGAVFSGQAKARMIMRLTSIARAEFRTLESISAPCSVKA